LSASDHDVIQRAHLDKHQGFLEPLRQSLVCLARLRISAWVVVREDHCCRFEIVLEVVVVFSTIALAEANTGCALNAL
jgi:hypothetical protein